MKMSKIVIVLLLLSSSIGIVTAQEEGYSEAELDKAREIRRALDMEETNQMIRGMVAVVAIIIAWGYGIPILWGEEQ